MGRFKRTLVYSSLGFLAIVSAGLVIYIPIYQEAVDDASNIEKRLTVLDSNPTKILSADGQILYSVAAVRRTVIDLTDPKYPSYVRYALVAAEDRRFFDHKGVDPMGLARAVWRRGAAGGGSTISMQLAKNLVNGDDRSLKRKLKDIATAQQIESLKSKDEILNLYANSSYFGEHAFGIERASEIYFNKTADKLTVGEAAMLARCVRLPGRVNPVKSLKKMLPLRDYVLNVMREEGWITEGQYEEGVQEVPRIYHGKSNGVRSIKLDAGYFVHHVLAQLAVDYPGVDFDAGGYTIQTTLSYALQKRAVRAVDDTLAEYRGDNVNDGAIVLMDASGRILAEVGGPSYAKRQYNVVTQGQGRQPGSSFKAIVYTTALKNGKLHPGDMISNAPIHKRINRHTWWSPQNASPRENASSYSLESAFALSVNRPAIHTIEDVGPKNVVAAAHDVFGIKSPLDPVDALALGVSSVKPVEMLEAYSVFMLGGDRVEPQPIVRVVGPDGEDMRPGGYDPKIHKAVLDPKIAKEMDEVMKGPVQFGTATYAQAVPNARGKTGTTNDHKDAWFCGYSDGLVAVAWTGNTSKTGGQLSMGRSVFGGTVPVKIWTALMESAHGLNLAKGVRQTPGTTVSAAAAPDEEPVVKPVRADDDADARPDPGAPKTKPDAPVTIDPGSDPNAAPTAPTGDPNDPTKADPDKTDPSKSSPPTTTPPDDPPKRTRRADSPPKATETEEVVVCVDTGLRANDYCPETVTRRFAKGRAPKKVCTLHHE